MKFYETGLTGSKVIEIDPIIDDRGFFSRIFAAEEFTEKKLNSSWVHINNSLSYEKGTLRGLHLQTAPHSEVKLVRCISGVVWDLIVDLRLNSSTYGKWYGCELSSDNRKMMYVPEGFAHGFITLTTNAEIIYFVSKPYCKESELTIQWNDPDISVEWPIDPIIISQKDQAGITLQDYRNIQ